jgi:hypothetical protein
MLCCEAETIQSPHRIAPLKHPILIQMHGDRGPRMREAMKGRATVAHTWFDKSEQRGWNRRNAMAPPEPNHFRGISWRRKATIGMMPAMTLQFDMTVF